MINTGKTTFILDASIEELVNILNADQKGDLFSCILAYANGHLHREPEEALTRAIFKQISKSMDQNSAKYFQTSKIKSLNRRIEEARKKEEGAEKIRDLEEKKQYLKEYGSEKFLELYPDEA